MGMGKPEPKNNKRKQENIMLVAALVLILAAAGLAGWKIMENVVSEIEAAKERRER